MDNLYSIFIYLLHQLQQFQRHFGFGAAEEVDVEDYAGLVARFSQDVAFKADELAAFDTDFYSDTQTAGVDGHGRFGVADHALQAEHLMVGNESEGADAEFVGTAGRILQETADEVVFLFYCLADGLRATYEYVCGDENPVNLLAAAVAPDPQFLLGGDVGLEVQIRVIDKRIGFFESLAASHLRVVHDDGYIPTFRLFSGSIMQGWRYACGDTKRHFA